MSPASWSTGSAVGSKPSIMDAGCGSPRSGGAAPEYFVRGTRITRDISAGRVGEDLGGPGPTPRWGWGGLERPA
ncbi:hypothetical protein [Streptomyces europaeiscabiei]|uniref:hypothetical protein n=1 Tax=Streptomyces europaeiscabiei TaxID=146819 RepID=UPI001F09F084|nr:hypothetical protein [Streptomyces europaeiscabiei]MDX3671270.1 hypothetical protein [Streptomyces europaeiscabiei]